MTELSKRQEKLLDFLVREYISTSEAVSSKALKKVAALNVCGATIRNDLQTLTKEGYIIQPHTSAGRIPTQKAYRYIAKQMTNPSGYFATSQCCKISIVRQIREAHEEMEREMRQMEELMDTLEDDNLFNILNILDQWHRRMM